MQRTLLANLENPSQITPFLHRLFALMFLLAIAFVTGPLHTLPHSMNQFLRSFP